MESNPGPVFSPPEFRGFRPPTTGHRTGDWQMGVPIKH